MLESLLEAIDRQLSQGKISWGLLITLLLFFNKIQRNKEFRIRDKRVERNQQRIMAKLEVEGEWAVDKPSWSERGIRMLLNGLLVIISPVNIATLFTRHWAIKNWRYTMQNLLSKKFLLAILGAIIPVINLQFGLHLTFDDLIGTWSILGIAIAAIAHVDAKTASTALNAVKVAVTADPNTTYKDMIKTVNVVHNAITSILADLKKDDGSAAFKAAADAYTQLHSIVNDFRKPDPLPEIPTLAETKVS